eukprot:m.1638790 g.1638790  ORF g.1638790 m.1638790 type:complete len:691 (+) comp30748_c0_seq1:214-2286(+)
MQLDGWIKPSWAAWAIIAGSAVVIIAICCCCYCRCCRTNNTNHANRAVLQTGVDRKGKGMKGGMNIDTRTNEDGYDLEESIRHEESMQQNTRPLAFPDEILAKAEATAITETSVWENLRTSGAGKYATNMRDSMSSDEGAPEAVPAVCDDPGRNTQRVSHSAERKITARRPGDQERQQNLLTKSSTVSESVVDGVVSTASSDIADWIGRRVAVEGYLCGGVLHFYGQHATKPKRGLRCGVALDDPVGKHDGIVDGHRYFQCLAQCGVLCLPKKVSLEPVEKAHVGNVTPQTSNPDTKDGYIDVATSAEAAASDDSDTESVLDADAHTAVIRPGTDLDGSASADDIVLRGETPTSAAATAAEECGDLEQAVAIRIRERSIASMRVSVAVTDTETATSPMATSSIAHCAPPLATAAVLHAFTPRNEDELELHPGDKILVLESPEGGWWRGALASDAASNEGWFPANHVNVEETAGGQHTSDVRPRSFFSLHASKTSEDNADLHDSTVSAPQPAATRATISTCIAIHRFSARNEDELTLETGDRVAVLAAPPGGWWEGQLDGATGWFPANHVDAAGTNSPPIQDSSDTAAASNDAPSSVSTDLTLDTTAAPVTAPKLIPALDMTNILQQAGKFGWKTHKVTATFVGRHADEVSMDTGMEVVLMQEGEGGWCEVICQGKHGWVPRPFLSDNPLN